jgi:hypothetical protein
MFRSSKLAALIVVSVSFTSSALAGDSCTYQLDLVQAFDAIGNPSAGAVQRTGDAWSFRRSDQAGALLTGIIISGVGAWGAPDQSFAVPLVGPRYSPVSARNQIGFYYRPPSFEGLMCHPGFGTIASEVWLTPQATVLLTGVTLQAELLGQFSPDAFVKLTTKTGASSETLFPAQSIVRLAAATSLSGSTSSTPLPLTLGPGTSLQLSVTNGGDASEDWLNAQISVTVQGPPTIVRQPRDIIISGPATGSFTVFSPGVSEYQWYRNSDKILDGVAATGAYINGATTANLEIYNPFFDDAGGGYYCIATNPCGSVTSTVAALSICPSDFDADGFITFNDFDAFVTSFEAGEAVADFNRDGFLTFEDFDAYVTAFEGGC